MLPGQGDAGEGKGKTCAWSKGQRGGVTLRNGVECGAVHDPLSWQALAQTSLTGREDAGKETSHETAWLRGVHERARRKVNGQGSPEAVLGHALGACVRMSSCSCIGARGLYVQFTQTALAFNRLVRY